MLNILKLNTLEGMEEYRLLLFSLNNSEPYFLANYFDVFCEGFENLICFYFRVDSLELTILMPGYLKPIKIGTKTTDFFDFITPYGYTGPFFSSNTKQSDREEFWKIVDNWYKRNNVVTEFIRFNLSGNHEHYSGTVFPTMLNIKGKIIAKELQWTAFDAKVRKNVNRAKRENLNSEIYYSNIEDDKIAEFYNIYIQTMKRAEAKENFFYSLEQFKIFINANTESVAICTIYFEKSAISSELLLVSNDSIYSFLGGTDEYYFDKRPNDFLKVEALDWARIEGKKEYILGGGYGFEDGIFKYKKSFFPNDVVYFYSGRKILNQKIFDDLVKEASALRRRSGLDALDVNDASFFPLYNK